MKSKKGYDGIFTFNCYFSTGRRCYSCNGIDECSQSLEELDQVTCSSLLVCSFINVTVQITGMTQRYCLNDQSKQFDNITNLRLITVLLKATFHSD